MTHPDNPALPTGRKNLTASRSADGGPDHKAPCEFNWASPASLAVLRLEARGQTKALKTHGFARARCGILLRTARTVNFKK